MKYIFSAIMFADGILAGFFGLRDLMSGEKKYIEDKFVMILSFASSIWSIGFAALFLQKDAGMAYIWRCIGMFGVFLYLISAQILLCHISGIRKIWRHFLDGFSLMGIAVYILVSQKDQVIFRLEDMGMTYHFRQGPINNIYVAYSVILAAGMLYAVIYMITHSKLKRVKSFGQKFLLTEGIIVAGMILDTVFPLIGMAAIPGSSLTQFWGIVVSRYAVSAINRSRININNMSEYIYYSLSVPVLVYDMNRRMKIINDAAVSFFGVSREIAEIENVGIGCMFDIDENEVFSIESSHKEVEAVCRNNHFYCNLAVNKINDTYGDVVGYIIIVTDLSEHKKIIKELEEAIEQAGAANRAKSAFLANMSHEIRTPMNAIIGFSELALNERLEPQVREYVDDIKTSSHSLLAIINDILDISKIESGKMELVCSDYYADSLFNDVYLIVDSQAKKKGLDFEMTVAKDVPNKMYGDKIRMRGVLINLLNNAVKYTNKGSVALKVKVLKKENGVATLEFMVMDTGIGIAPEDKKKLFETFAQVDSHVNYGKEGTGLGLAISKGIVTLMGGEITVDSVYGKGSTFTVTVDQKIVDDGTMNKLYTKAETATEDFTLGDMRVSGVKVLVVDDNRVNLKMAGKSMQHYGLEVETAGSGAQAIEMCKNTRYNLIFMDQMMPQMDGIEAMDNIRRLDKYYDYGGECKIIILTANAVSGMREQLMNRGFDEFMGKPMNFRQLERIITKFIPEEKIIQK